MGLDVLSVQTDSFHCKDRVAWSKLLFFWKKTRKILIYYHGEAVIKKDPRINVEYVVMFGNLLLEVL